MLEHKDLLKLHDKAYSANQVTREQASDDLVFYWVSQWDDDLLSESQLSFRGEFNILRKAGRQIMADLRLNPVQPDFKPKDENREDDAEILDGLYRADDRRLSSQEAYDFATQDAVVCGYGAWEIYTEYETNRIGDTNQVIRRRYIPEANNTCFFDPNAKSLDKSDANYVSILYNYSEDGYKDLVKELTGEEPDCSNKSFAFPEQSFNFPWASQQEHVYVCVFYHRKKVKDNVLTLTRRSELEASVEPPMIVRESEAEDMLDELVNDGFEVTEEKEIERWEVTRYIASGDDILSAEVVAGENIPVIPVYGEYVPQVEGECVYQGITRLAKDPQRLRNFQMSYLADIVSRSPRNKPIFLPEQVQGFEFMYEENGADNNYPYLLQNKTDGNGSDLPIGPISVMPDQGIPQALAASIDLTRQAVEDVANPGIAQDIADPDLSGKAVLALQNRMDQQSYIYQHNFKHAKRRDAEVYASMANDVFDTPRRVTIETQDGTKKQAELFMAVLDDNGNPKVINDLTNIEFDVYAEIGTTFESQKQQTLEQLGSMMAGLQPDDPLQKILLMKSIELMPGVKFDDVREYARQQLVLMGIKEPETPEEMQMLQQSQQPQPDAAMVLAQAEQIKAQAQLAETQRKAQKDIADTQIDAGKLEISAYEAQTGRAEQEVKAAQAQVSVSKTLSEKQAIDIDSQLKVAQSIYRASASQRTM